MSLFSRFGTSIPRFELRIAHLALLTMVAANAGAQGPIGPEIQVNSYTTGTQFFPEVVKAADGGFLVLWRGDPSHFRTHLRPFGADGQALTEQQSEIAERFIEVAADPAGGFIAVWQETSGVDTVISSRLDALGNPIGPLYQVNEDAPSLATLPDIEADPNGGFVVAWRQGDRLAWKRLGAEGEPVGDQIVVDADISGAPYLAVNGLGNSVVAWRQFNSGISSVNARLFAADGTPGLPFAVAPELPQRQGAPSIQADSEGRFLIAWNQDSQILRGHWLTADGTSVYGLDLGAIDSSGFPEIGCDGMGRCAVTWKSDDDIRAGWLTSSSLIENPIAVNAFTALRQEHAQIDCDAGGDCVVVWTSGSNGLIGPDGDESAIRAQRFTFDPTFSLVATPFERQLCQGDSVDFDLTIERFNGFADAVELEASGGPPGALLEITPDVVGSGEGTAVLSFSSPDPAPPGVFTLTLDGASVAEGSVMSSGEASLRVLPLEAPAITAPGDGAAFCSTSLGEFEWTTLPDAASYRVEIARDAAFTDIVFAADTMFSNLDMPSGLPGGDYFWRVGACAKATVSSTFRVLGECGPQGSGEVVRVDDGTRTPSEPAVAITCDGRGLALWTAADGNGMRSIQGRWVLDGSLVGAVFQVNETAGDPKQPDARVTGDGKIVVSWRDGLSLRWRSFDPFTLAGSAERSVTLAGEVLGHGIGPAGELAAAWKSGPASVFQGQRFDSLGAELGNAFEVGDDPEVSVSSPHLGQSADGFVVSYDALGYDGGLPRTFVKAKRFTSTGTAIASEFVLETGQYGVPIGTSVGQNRVDANADGDFVVSWRSRYTDKYAESHISVRARLFDATGAAVAVSGASEVGYGGSIAVLGPSRQFLVVWNDEAAGLAGRRVLPSIAGAPTAEAISSFEPQQVDLAFGLPTSAAAIVWTSFECDGPAPCVLLSPVLSGPGILADGFESGNSGSWCRSAGEP